MRCFLAAVAFVGLLVEGKASTADEANPVQQNAVDREAAQPSADVSPSEEKIAAIIQELRHRMHQQAVHARTGGYHYFREDGVLKSRLIETPMQQLRDIGSPAVPQLVKSLANRRRAHTSFRRTVFEILRDIGDPRATDALIEALSEPRYVAPQVAIEGLVKIGEPVVEPLLQVIQGERPGNVTAAASILGQLGDKRAVEPLLQALEHGHEWAIRPLGELGDRRAIAPLSKLVTSSAPNSSAQKAAIQSLARLGDPQGFDLLVELFKQAKTPRKNFLALQLGKVGEKRAIPVLIDELRKHLGEDGVDEDGADGKAADGNGGGGGGGVSAPDWFPDSIANALGEICQDSIAPLLPYLDDKHPRIQETIVAAIGKSKDKAAIKVLLDVLSNHEGRARCFAFVALCKLRNPDTIEPVIAALKGRSVCRSHYEVGRKIENFGEVAIEPLIRGLNEGDRFFAAGAALALGEIGDSRAVDPLAKYLENCDPKFSAYGNAIKAIGEINDPRSVTVLLEYLRVHDKNGPLLRWYRVSAARGLGNLGDRSAVEVLVTLTDDNEKVVRRAAATALGKIGDSEACEALHAMLMRENETEKLAAVVALGQIADKRSIEPLLEFKANEVFVALSQFGKEGVPQLIAALKHEDVVVRCNAAEVLGMIRDRRALKPLLSALEDEHWWVRFRAATALGELGDAKAIPGLIATLDRSDHSLSSHVQDALWSTGEPAVEPLIGLLGSESVQVRQHAVTALARIEDPRGIKALRKLLETEQSQIVRFVLNDGLYDNSYGPPAKQK